jgi:hypothetical protein
LVEAGQGRWADTAALGAERRRSRELVAPVEVVHDAVDECGAV